MGCKKDLALRRCMSLQDEREQASEELRSRAAAVINNAKQMTSVCPVIRIEECPEEDFDKPRGVTHLHSKKAAFGDATGAMQSNGCASPLLQSPSSSRKAMNFLEVPENSDLSALKATAIRLNLRTRRSSFLEWQAWMDRSRAPPVLPPYGDSTDKLTSERKERINDALEWLKTELTLQRQNIETCDFCTVHNEMRCMDQHLARQLLALRHDINQLRLRRSCKEHRDLLDDVQSDLEEQEELSDILDLPNTSVYNTRLKQLGVTRMNLSARRFSTC